MPEMTEEQKARINAVLAQHGIASTRKKPTRAQIESASRTLVWLSEESDDGALRNMIGEVRHALTEHLPDGGA